MSTKTSPGQTSCTLCNVTQQLGVPSANLLCDSSESPLASEVSPKIQRDHMYWHDTSKLEVWYMHHMLLFQAGRLNLKSQESSMNILQSDG